MQPNRVMLERDQSDLAFFLSQKRVKKSARDSIFDQLMELMLAKIFVDVVSTNILTVM